MDIPELRLVRRTLKREGIKAEIALAVLLRTMMADHVDTLLELGDEAYGETDYLTEPEPNTRLEWIFRRLKDDIDVNSELFSRHWKAAGGDALSVEDEDAVVSTFPAGAQAASELFVHQDRVRELLAVFIDAGDNLHTVLAERDGGEIAGGGGVVG